MAIETQIISKDGESVELRRGFFNGRPQGLVSFTSELYNWEQRSLLFLDENGSRSMAIDASFGGTPDGVHNGTDSVEWTAAATVGTWDFSSTTQAHSGTKSIEALNMSNGDIATISKGSDLDFTGYVSVTGWIYITRFNATGQELMLSMYDNGAIVGNDVNVMSYVNAASLNTWQKFSIPKADIGVADVNVDAMVIEFVVNSGSAPRLYLDDIQIEETGGKAFSAVPSVGKLVQIKAIEFTFADALDTTLTNGTMHNLSYDKILGVSSLTTGIGLQRFQDGQPQVNVIMKNICDMLASTFDIINVGCDGTNTFLKLRVELPVYVTLDSIHSDKFQLNISDDLSGLLEFRAIAIGRELIPHED